MTDEWRPERVIDEELAARTIAVQFPELASLPVRTFDAGWDNVVFTVGERWVFRFVHRAVALDGSRRELAVLARLGPLPLPVPQPRFVGRSTDEVPWPFWGAELLAGVGLAESGLAPERRGWVARELGTFLRALHDQPAARYPELPVDPIGRGDPARQAVRAERRLIALVALGGQAGDEAAELLDASGRLRAQALDASPGVGRALVHGDLHARHVLVDGERPAGVIDWGDTAVADPSVDLLVAWAGFDPEQREELLGAYGPVDAGTRLRARVTALHVCAGLAYQAHVDGQSAVAAEAIAGVRRATTD